MESAPANRADAQLAVPLSADLHLYLFDRPLHPELFRQYKSFRVAQGRYYADIWFIGLGHVVSLTAGQKSVVELMAVESDLLPTRGVLSRFRLKGERDHERRIPDGCHYMVSTQVETMDEALYKSVHSDLVKHAVKRGWHVLFDQWADGDMQPFSYIDQEARDGEFHVHAFHAFPAERTIVKTQSIFELPA
ncbi:MAG: DUF2617 family protein [Planctomycetia bacterium]|nr:MAG: DUF2617 family protein [Planctomycetia bacterium]